MKFQIGFLAVFIFSLLTACSDAVDPTPVTVIDGKLLVNDKGWIVISSVKEDGTSKKDLLVEYDSCVADNIYKFTTADHYVIDEGEMKCKKNDSQSKESGSWKLSGTSLVMNPVGDVPYQFTISFLSDEKLVFEYTEIGINGIVISVTTTTFKPASAI